jgi:small subunit ribosomal protein S7
MARRHRATKREIKPDARHGSTLVSVLISKILRSGKRTLAERVVYGAIEQLAQKIENSNPIEILQKAIDNIRPKLEVKSRRVGGATYQVPMEVPHERQVSLALRWLVDYADARKATPMRDALAAEILDAYNNTGNAVKKRDDMHKMAQANRAFAHYRW